MTLLVLRVVCVINQDSHTSGGWLSPRPGITGFSPRSVASQHPFGLGFFEQLLWSQSTNS